MLIGLVLAGCAHRSFLPHEAAPQAAACPAELPPDARCLQGRDSAGAFYPCPRSGSGTLATSSLLLAA
jgi:hypothetical protein